VRKGALDTELVVADIQDVNGAPFPLSGGETATQHSVSPDGKWVTYGGKRQYLVDVSEPTPGSPQALSDPLSSNTNRAMWAPDSSMVAYSAKVGSAWQFLVNDVTHAVPTLPSEVAPALESVTNVGQWQP
jgi:hypothetical protein